MIRVQTTVKENSDLSSVNHAKDVTVLLLSCGIGVFVSPTGMVHLHSALPLRKLMVQVVPAPKVFCV